MTQPRHTTARPLNPLSPHHADSFRYLSGSTPNDDRPPDPALEDTEPFPVPRRSQP
ncbi:hypothetical protein GLX30_03370 [Streptomyces sp. Tu 2975]|uniref:hypothetical protein n=1 Tax=Streptomyces sp. Tu 2975 TaxID=2676871 RepID=UPI00135C41CF|nr:hypothetical protein [Streptomyces sp. Tu 2975]QIP83269.1 hypothetical protein GLX30_03370 [Streptomyces sp. Tu 2975]